MNVNRRSWMTTDDYLAEKEGMQRATSPLAVTARPQQYRRTGSKYSNPAILVTTPKASEPVIRNGVGRQSNSIIQPGSEFSMSLTPQNLPKSFEFAKSEDTTEQPLTQQQVNAQLTTAYTFQQLDEALRSIIDFNNRKFKYNAKESPLYTILEQQAAEEARLASGRAYARSVANTGGYGSSYATLAAEEASRQVMEGMNDQQYALYQAAKDEFEAERQSRLDWYNMMKQFNADAIAKEEYEKLRTDEATRAAGGLTETVQNAYNAAVQIWDGTNEAQVRSVLKNQGLTDAEIEATVGMLRGDTKAVIEDNVKMFEKNPTLSGAVSIMNEARLSGNENEFVDRISSATAKAFSTAITDYSTAGSVLGFEQSEWDQLDDESKGTRIISTAGEAFKNGILTEKDFSDILMESVEKDFSDPEIDITEVLANVNGVLLLRDNGTITEDISKRLLEGIAKIPAAQQASEKITKDLQNVFVKPIMSKAEKEAFRALYLAINGK